MSKCIDSQFKSPKIRFLMQNIISYYFCLFDCGVKYNSGMLLTSIMKFIQERGRPLCHTNDSSLANISYEKLLTTGQTDRHA